MSNFEKPKSFFDYLEKILKAIEDRRFSSSAEYDGSVLLIDPDYTAETRAQNTSLAMVANFLVLGTKYADSNVFGSVLRLNQFKSSGKENLLFVRNVWEHFDPKRSQENLEILKTFFSAKDLPLNHDSSSEVSFGPIPMQYEQTIKQVFDALEMFQQNLVPDARGYVSALRLGSYTIQEMEGEHFAVVISYENASRLLHHGSFDPFKHVRTLSGFKPFDLDEWSIDMRMC